MTDILPEHSRIELHHTRRAIRRTNLWLLATTLSLTLAVAAAVLLVIL
jgi:hypothetical protein